ncbi:MAG: hypothetical protein EOO24_40960, partial [Comamonadaceae bacterium]
MTPESARIRFVLVAMAMVVASNVTGSLTHAGPRFALVSTAVTLAVMVGWTAWRRDPVLARWLLIGLVAGWMEILTDAWLVQTTGTLVHPPDEPMVLDSPLYMPFAWTLVATILMGAAIWQAQVTTLKEAAAKHAPPPPPLKTRHAIRPPAPVFTGNIVDVTREVFENYNIPVAQRASIIDALTREPNLTMYSVMQAIT